MQDLSTKVKTATKWSAVTEIAAKLAAPVSGMIMARILTPEAYGAMAAISIIQTFASLFSDAGFKQFIIQHEFKSEQEKIEYTNVAFWTNLGISLLLWLLIIAFRNQLAELVGSPELGLGIAVACAGIPISAFSTLQAALYQRDFDFKTLFYTRLAGISIPFLVNIPLALYTRNYWALIIGGLVSGVVSALILGIKSKWKPRLYYNIPQLREMFSFSMWLLLDALLIWATSYIDIFLIGRNLDEHYLGLYRTSTNLVGQLLAIVTGIVIPVLLPTLSRLQNDTAALKQTFLRMQKYAALFVIPLGFGFLIFRNLITDIALGSQWAEAAPFIGIWGFTSAIMIVTSHFCSRIYIAVGKPHYAIWGQTIHLVFLVPTTIVAVHYGFETLYIARTLIRYQGLLTDFIFVYVLIHLTPAEMIKNILFIQIPRPVLIRYLYRYAHFIKSDRLYVRLMFYLQLGYWPNLRHPKTYCEKVQWLKLHDHRDEYTTLVDKYAVKSYMRERLGSQYVVPLFGWWDHPREIDWNTLPDKFVLKTTANAGSLGVIVCKDKDTFDKEETIRKLERALSENTYIKTREYPYKHIQPCIIAEQLLEEDSGPLKDYKVLCFDGKPKFIGVQQARQSGVHIVDYFDTTWNRFDAGYADYPCSGHEIPRPKCLEEMLRLSEKLAQGMPHVRIDWYIVHDELYFGEFTFYHNSGFIRFTSQEKDLEQGSWITL